MTTLTAALTGFDLLDNPSEEFISEMRRRYPTERETEELLARKLRKRSELPYRRATLEDLSGYLHKMLVFSGTFCFSCASSLVNDYLRCSLAYFLQNHKKQSVQFPYRLSLRVPPRVLLFF